MIFKVPSQTIPRFYNQEEACQESDEHLQLENPAQVISCTGNPKS